MLLWQGNSTCGGINKIQRGAVGECEYCGSPISGE